MSIVGIGWVEGFAPWGAGWHRQHTDGKTEKQTSLNRPRGQFGEKVQINVKPYHLYISKKTKTVITRTWADNDNNTTAQ